MAASIWKDFGSWIKARRENAKLSQDGAARRAEIDRQQWYRIENGLSGTRRDTVIRMAQAVSADPNDALQRAGFSAPEQPFERPKPQTVKELLDRLRELGIEPLFHGGVESLPDDPDLLADILNDFETVIALRLRKRKPDDPTSGTGLLPG